MAETLLRTFTPELEVRAASKGGDGRTIEGLAVPYGQRQRITPDLVEQFARGAFNAQIAAAHRVKFARDHPRLGGAVIGRAVELRDDAAGLWGAWRVSATQAGDEALELARDGVLDELSIGFRERQNRRLDDGTIVRVTAHLVEVSLVMEGAYGRGALVSAVRRAGCTCGGCTCSSALDGLAEVRRILDGLPELPPAA